MKKIQSTLGGVASGKKLYLRSTYSEIQSRARAINATRIVTGRKMSGRPEIPNKCSDLIYGEYMGSRLIGFD